jgi:hypothetical protein
VNLSMKVLRIHTVIAFEKRLWLKAYIDPNTTMRQRAKSDFEKDFYKLMNNAFFGKSMENVRKHRNVDLVCDSVKFKNCCRNRSWNSS